jgi:Acetyltransferase (GNAT) domain
MGQSADRLLAHDPVWLAGSGSQAGDGGVDRAVAYTLHRDGQLVGYAPFHRSVRTLRFVIGELTLYRHRVPSLTLTQDVTLAALSDDERADFIRGLLGELAKSARPERAIFLDGVPVDSILVAVVKEVAAVRDWIFTPLGEAYEHQFADLPPSFEKYQRQLGSRSRKSLRYSQRKLAEHLGGMLHTRCFTQAHEVPEFVAAAQEISRKTYQWKLLGLGLQDAAALTARLSFAADLGWLRCYLLYCGDQAAAFMVGYLYCGVYYYIDVGYDPDWAKWSVGSVLQMEVVKDLLSGQDRPDRFDFSTGFATHKARFGNVSRMEANILLLKRGLLNRGVDRAYRMTTILERWAAFALESLGIKTRIKKWLRRVA